jgi:hypothetical protein
LGYSLFMVTTFTVAAATYTVPSAWLMGRAQAHRRAGLNHKAAMLEAMLDWHEQAEMEAALTVARAA